MIAKKTFSFNFLRTLTLVVSVVGTAGSLYFMFNAGRNQKSIFLIVLFTAWVLSPFIGFFLANKIAKHWTFSTRALLYWLIIILTIISLVTYSGAFSLPGTKPGFIFLIAPLISWLLIAIFILIARSLSRKNKSV
jgi:hypothetical protein